MTITGSPGADDQCMRTIQTLLNVVDFGMNVQQAIEAPRWATRSFPASPFPHTMYPGEMSVEQRVPEAARDALIKRGHKLRVAGPWTMGSLAAIVVDASEEMRDREEQSLSQLMRGNRIAADVSQFVDADVAGDVAAAGHEAAVGREFGGGQALIVTSKRQLRPTAVL